MLIEIKGKYNNPISMVEDVYNTKKTGDKVPDLDGRNPSQMTKACLPSHGCHTRCGTWT